MPHTLLDTTTSFQVPDDTVRTIVQNDGLASLPTYLKNAHLADNRVFIITDSKVEPLYGETISKILSNATIPNSTITIPAGEENKTLAQVGQIIDTLSAAKATRKDVIVTLGGGVVGDLGGFVASIYNRGLPLVHIPTTLLAMVDSSIGGKTGVDHGGKNKTGSFYQAKIILADPAVLKTLDRRTYIEGFGEIVKYAMLDAQFLDMLESSADKLGNQEQLDIGVLADVIAHCITQKTSVTQADPLELAVSGRVLLNYGHTLAHALEAATNYTELLHGEAVAIGMSYAAQLAVHVGITNQSFVERQITLLQTFGLPTRYTGRANLDTIMDQMTLDKKNETTRMIRFVLPKKPGETVVEDIEDSVIRQTVEKFLS